MSLQLSNGELSGLVGGPVSDLIYLVIVLLIAWPLLRKFINRKERERTAVGSGS